MLVLGKGARIDPKQLTGEEVESAALHDAQGGAHPTEDRTATLAYAEGLGGSTLVYTGTTMTPPERVIAGWNLPGLNYSDAVQRTAKFAEQNSANFIPDELIFVLRDRELGQIAAFQRTLTNAAPCSVLPDDDLTALAAVAGVGCVRVDCDADLAVALTWALGQTAQGKSAVLDVATDYTHRTFFTRGVVAANIGRLLWRDRLRMLGRAVSRRVGM